MRSIASQVALAALVVLAGCGGGGTASLPPTASSADASARAALSDHGRAKTVTYAGIIQDLVPPCGSATASCTGSLTVAVNRTGSAINGTWSELFTNPTLRDQGTFAGVMTTPTTFTATFQSPADAPCTLTVSGTLTEARLDATYTFNTNAGCPVVDHGVILLRKAEDRDGDRERDD